MVTFNNRSTLIAKRLTPLPHERKQLDSLTDDEKNVTYFVGEFVYVPGIEPGSKPSVVVIEKLFTPKPGVAGYSGKYFTGSWFCYPEGTLHPPERKFMEREVFKTTYSREDFISEISGKCYVLHLRDYVCWYPEGYAKEHIYVCESKYAETTRNISLIKDWRKILGVMPVNPPRLKRYDVPLRIYRNVPSIHASNSAGGADDQMEEVIVTPKTLKKSGASSGSIYPGISASGSKKFLPGIPSPSSEPIPICTNPVTAAANPNMMMMGSMGMPSHMNLLRQQQQFHQQHRPMSAGSGGNHQFFSKDGKKERKRERDRQKDTY